MDLTPWFWGAAGAFVYAGPQLSACLFGAPTRVCGKCLIDFAFALVIGPIIAGAFGAVLCARLHYTAPRDLNAIAASLGLLANPIAPGAIQVAVDSCMTRLKKLLGVPTL